MDEFYLIAEVESIYDQEGSVIVKSFSDFPERFFELERVLIEFFGSIKELEVEFSKKIDDLIIVKFRKFNSEDDVHFLLGKKLYVYEHDLFQLPDDAYYIHDLIDCDVYFNSLFFGKLVDVLKLPGNDVYLIKKKNGNDVMLPAVKQYIEKLDIKNKKLFLSPECELFDEDEN